MSDVTPGQVNRASFSLGLVVGAIIGAAVLFSIYYVPRKGILLDRSPRQFTVVLKEAHGLSAGSPVTISGVEAGEVTDVRIEDMPKLGWRVLGAVTVFDGERFGSGLKMGSTYAVERSGLLGEMILAITPGGKGDALANGDYVDGTPPLNVGKIAEDVKIVTGRLADFMDGKAAGDPSLRKALRDLQILMRNLKGFSEKLPQ